MKKLLASILLIPQKSIPTQDECCLWLTLTGACLSCVVLLHCLLDTPLGQSAEHVNDRLWRFEVEATFPPNRADLLSTESSRITDTITMVRMNSIADNITMVDNIPQESSARC